MQDIYNDHTYLANNPTWHEEDAPFKAERIMRLLRRNAIARNSICEVGCGSGEILVQLAAQLPPTTRLTGKPTNSASSSPTSPSAPWLRPSTCCWLST
jgi:hypothetical protein